MLGSKISQKWRNSKFSILRSKSSQKWRSSKFSILRSKSSQEWRNSKCSILGSKSSQKWRSSKSSILGSKSSQKWRSSKSSILGSKSSQKWRCSKSFIDLKKVLVVSLSTLAQPQRTAPFSESRGGRPCLDFLSTKWYFFRLKRSERGPKGRGSDFNFFFAWNLK